jgi:transcription antitermination factor NusB
MANTSRRRIREAVVQFLYAVSPAEKFAAPPDEAVLALLLEPLREKLTRARAKAVLHLQQGRDKIITGFPDLLRPRARIEISAEDGELGRAIRTWDKEEQALKESLDGLRHEMNGNRDARRLRESLERTRLANRASLAAAARVSAADVHFPALQQLREDALSLRAPLALLSERLNLALGEAPHSLPELKAVAKAEAEITATCDRIQSYLEGLRTHLPGIDQHLASVIENFTPERLDRVDRAILRLATYELLFDDEIPPAVAIDEAIELARSFGTTESPKFVNGVLDRLMKEHSS